MSWGPAGHGICVLTCLEGPGSTVSSSSSQSTFCGLCRGVHLAPQGVCSAGQCVICTRPRPALGSQRGVWCGKKGQKKSCEEPDRRRMSEYLLLSWTTAPTDIGHEGFWLGAKRLLSSV